jgi:hypothetical protein
MDLHREFMGASAPTGEPHAARQSAKHSRGGRYARLMGTLHRHPKARLVGDAALGLYARILSYCADNGRWVVSPREFIALTPEDRNRGKKLRALLVHRLLDVVPGGYSPHDWRDHNPGIACREGSSRPAEELRVRADRPMNAAAIATRDAANASVNATAIVHSNARSDGEHFRGVEGVHSRPRTQDPRLSPPEARTAALVNLEATQHRAESASTAELVLTVYAAHYEAETGTPAPSPGASAITAARKLGSWLDAQSGSRSVESMLDSQMATLFADPWAKERGYPLGAVASNPLRYLGGGPRRRGPSFAAAPAASAAFAMAPSIEEQFAQLGSDAER